MTRLNKTFNYIGPSSTTHDFLRSGESDFTAYYIRHSAMWDLFEGLQDPVQSSALSYRKDHLGEPVKRGDVKRAPLHRPCRAVDLPYARTMKRVSPLQVALLVPAGILAGVVSTVAGLASLVSYPALLLVGLPPVVANVTNTVSLVANGLGAVISSRRELRGRGHEVATLLPLVLSGGLSGGIVLLAAPSDSFEKVVPFFIAGAALTIQFPGAVDKLRHLPRSAPVAAGTPEQDRVVLTGGRGPQRNGTASTRRRYPIGGRPVAARAPVGRTEGSVAPAAGSIASQPGYAVAVFLVAAYGGYFGAAAGVLMLALLNSRGDRPFAVDNALKNAAMAGANLVAAVLFLARTAVCWEAVIPLAAGLFIGGCLGPAIFRRLGTTLLRRVIAGLAVALAVALFADAYF